MPKLPSMRDRPTRTSRHRAAVAAAILAATVLAAAAPAGADDIDDFEGSWLESALEQQYELGSDVGFDNAPLVGTHNSFNSRAEMGAGIEESELNQVHDLTEQLDFGVRALELDLHREPNGSGGDERPIVCHTQPREGCTVVRDMAPFLIDIADWLGQPAHSDQVLLLYLEDDLDNLAIHNVAASIIDEELGDLIYRPEGRGCVDVGDELTRDDVRAADSQIVVVSGCGKGAAWHDIAFSWERHRESRPYDFEDFPKCGPDYRRLEYRTNLIRYYEDSTRTAGSGGADDGIDPEAAAAMVRCGVDLFGFDRLEPFDGRLEATVWSWATDEPSVGGCALIRAGEKLPFGRWVSERCGGLEAPVVCRDGRRWSVSRRRLGSTRAAGYCERHDAEFAAPRTGYENQLVRVAMKERKTRSALLGIRLRDGEWTPLDPRES